jgi:hypothetical protein
MVQHTGPLSQGSELQHMSFLWICWYGHNFSHKVGWKAKRLHHIGFVDADDPFTFGSMDLQFIIHGVHLIPAFNHGCTGDLLQPDSIARTTADGDKDWQFYYVGM